MENRRLLFSAGWFFPFVLAGLFFWKGTQYDPAFFEPPVTESESGAPIPAAVDGWTLAADESLPADRMYERINGRASYYLQYGAVTLHYGTWSADEQTWDMYLYEFSAPAGARGAFEGEAPSESRELEGVKGYALPGQVAAVGGTFYLQLSAYQAKAATAAAEKLAVELALTLGGDEEMSDDAKEERTPSALAGEAAIAETEEYLPQNAFGFSSLQMVRTVWVALDETETVWFRAVGGAEELTDYADELTDYGGSELFEADSGTGGSMFGSWEFVAEIDGALWGIRDAASKETLLKHWFAMKTALEGK